MNEIANIVRNKRELLGLTQAEFAEILSLKVNGGRTVRGWEKGEHTPSPARLQTITALKRNKRFVAPKEPKFRFIDLFAGVGGIRLPFQQAGGECVFSSEWDKHAKKTYAVNYGELPKGDITQIPASEIPTHDILLAGFPCQAFSQAGRKLGFMDTRGTMFFEIQRILAKHQPKAFLLENVKQLKGHDKGRTLQTILSILRGEEIPHETDFDGIPMSEEAKSAVTTKLNYWVDYRVLRAADFGVPQNRERIFLVGFLKNEKAGLTDEFFNNEFKWPTPPCKKTRLGNVLYPNAEVPEKYTITDKMWIGHQNRKARHRAKGNGFGYSLFNHEDQYANTISARYWKDGSEILIDQSDLGKNPRTLTPRECARLQGFPESFILSCVSDAQAYKQMGNSVSVPVVRSVCRQMMRTIDTISLIDALKDRMKRHENKKQVALAY